MRGDRVEVVVDTGNGTTREYGIVATKAGRRVEVATVRGQVEVSEVTRSGRTVRTARFMATRVVALVEHPAADEGDDDAESSEPATGRRRRKADSGQSSLL